MLVFDSPNTTVACRVPVRLSPSDVDDIRIPDLLVAFDCDRGLIEERRGYALKLMARPPDFVLEAASPTTGVTDYRDKRLDYARYGIPEYWRFDPSGGDHYDVALAGDRLVDSVYEPMEVERLDDGVWRGYSETLGLHVCWEHGRLRFFDSITESYLLSHEEEAEARRDAEAEIRRLRARLEELARGARSVRQIALSLSGPPRLT